MGFDDIPAVRFFDNGVSFRYLVFRIQKEDEEKILVRGLNFLPYEPEIEQRIINETVTELEELGQGEAAKTLATSGGGTATLNPYYEKLTLFGADAREGSEENREQVFELVKNAFPQHEVEWYKESHAAEVEKKEKEKKAKAKAAREAAKKKREAAKAAKEEEDQEDEETDEESSGESSEEEDEGEDS